MNTKKNNGVDRRLVHLAEGARLSRQPGICRRFLTAVRAAGLIGEEQNALMFFLVGTSRLLPHPVNLFIKGPSSSGKNFLASRVLKFFPTLM